MSSPMIPAPIGTTSRPLKLHDRMWTLYVLEARSAKETAATLNAEFNGSRETAGSVVSYADRQAWGKAARSGLPQATEAHKPEPVRVRLNKPPLVDKALEPAPQRDPAAARPVMVEGPAKPRVDLAGPAKAEREPVPNIAHLDDESAPDFTQPVRPEHLHHLQCKWPIGSPGSASFRHCGKRRLSGLPYCADHCETAYPPGSLNRKKARDAQKN